MFRSGPHPVFIVLTVLGIVALMLARPWTTLIVEPTPPVIEYNAKVYSQCYEYIETWVVIDGNEYITALTEMEFRHLDGKTTIPLSGVRDANSLGATCKVGYLNIPSVMDRQLILWGDN